MLTRNTKKKKNKNFQDLANNKKLKRKIYFFRKKKNKITDLKKF